jgi:hypothetical protein
MPTSILSILRHRLALAIVQFNSGIVVAAVVRLPLVIFVSAVRLNRLALLHC